MRTQAAEHARNTELFAASGETARGRRAAAVQLFAVQPVNLPVSGRSPRRGEEARELAGMPGCAGGEAGGAAARGVHPRYVPERGRVLRGALGALFGCFRPAKTRPLPQ